MVWLTGKSMRICANLGERAAGTETEEEEKVGAPRQSEIFKFIPDLASR